MGQSEKHSGDGRHREGKNWGGGITPMNTTFKHQKGREWLVLRGPRRTELAQ